MSTTLTICLAQLNLFVGDIQGNLKKLIWAAITARDDLHADMIVFPELSITGYPPEDLLLRKSFIDASTDALSEFMSRVENIYCVIGHPKRTSKGLFNACSIVYNQAILGQYAKQNLPNDGVFDEHRYFIEGHSPCVVPIKGIPVGIAICEDVWHHEPIQQSLEEGARLIVSPNASPFEIDKQEQRERNLAKRTQYAHVPVVYVNCIGGQDELVFDGGSMVVDASGQIVQHAGFFKETLLTVQFVCDENKINITPATISLPDKEKRVYEALVLGVRDYIQKNRFSGAILGLSGGIDSALTLAIAVDAIGKENVSAILMPSRHTSDMSKEDAMLLANHLGVHTETISIEPAFTGFLESLTPVFSGKKSDVTEENLQSRCRGVILMAISNKTGRIVLTTGNRSELAVGYSTLYGDMAGGLCVLKDIPKTLVYRLAKYRNTLDPVIPKRIFERPPTAELAPNQKDSDTLPPYDVLDTILNLYLNEEQSMDAILQQGFPKEVVMKIIHAIHTTEYKRRQSPVGIRISHKAFGRDRRYPISSGFKQ